MADINTYANDLLLDFLDEFHQGMKESLEATYGEEWLKSGVERHLAKGYFDRTRQMLESPMRVVDMEKTDEELYGVEHLSNIIDGNWDLFKDKFVDRPRTKVFLSEISEVRHNISHRRRRHYLRREELVRFVQNCYLLLSAFDSPKAQIYVSVIDNLLSGGIPWGSTIGGYLPSQDEVVDEFVGRPEELRRLSEWLAGDSPQLVLWGYGGAGKSATAYKFGRDIQDASPQDIQAVCWVSAKRVEYQSGQSRELVPDFFDVESFCSAVWVSLYGIDDSRSANKAEELIQELKETRILLIIDDFDTILENHDLAELLVFGLRDTGCKILYTSRQRYPALRDLEITAFNGSELEEFIKVRAPEFSLDIDSCLVRLKGIEAVTGGYPLFVNDLLRYSMVDGLLPAIEAWSQRKGDAAREYALRRQLERLGYGGLDVLFAISAANRPLESVEIASVTGLTDDDVDQGVRDLLNWRLISHIAGNEGSSSFSINHNTRRLVQKTYSSDARLRGIEIAYRTLTGERVPGAKRTAIAGVIRRAHEQVLKGDIETAALEIVGSMNGELVDSPDLYGVLGWAYSSLPNIYADEAIEAFTKAHRLGAVKEETYFHWANLERERTESSIGRHPESDVIEGWRRCAQIATWGVERGGASDLMCHLVAYSHSREGKSLDRNNQFIPAQSAYQQGAEWFRRALKSPLSTVRYISKGAIHRGLVLAIDGLQDVESMALELRNWRTVAPQDNFYAYERERLLRRYPGLIGKV